MNVKSILFENTSNADVTLNFTGGIPGTVGTLFLAPHEVFMPRLEPGMKLWIVLPAQKADTPDTPAESDSTPLPRN